MASEIRVTLPDGSEKRLPAGSTGADLAKAIGPGLAKAALALRVNGEVRDLARPLPDGKRVAILTDKDPQALDVLRHSSAHVLATAVRQLFPLAKSASGRLSKTASTKNFQWTGPSRQRVSRRTRRRWRRA